MKKIFTCSDCGIEFEEPLYHSWKENHGFGYVEPWTEMICPFCGSAEVHELWEFENDAAEDSV